MKKLSQISKKATKEFAILNQMSAAASRTAAAISTVGARPARGGGARSLANPHSYSDNPIEATGKIYRKVADKILRVRFRKMTPEKRKKVVWFSTFEKLEEMTDGASEHIVLAIDCLYDACVAIHGPGKAFDEDVFIEYALHGGPEDSSRAFSRLKVLNESSDSLLKNYMLVDALMQMYEYQFFLQHPEKEYISWNKVSGEELTRNLVYLDPVAYDLGIGANERLIIETYDKLRRVSSAKVS